MIRFAWLGFGLIGALVAVLSGGLWWVAIIGGAITAASIVLQFVDAKPFDRVITPDDFVREEGGNWFYQETSWHANGRVSINVFALIEGRWTEVGADNGIGDKNCFWIRLGPSSPESYRVVAR